MRAEFYRDRNGGQDAAVATWDGRRVSIEASDADARSALERVFRLVPVVVDDAALRSLGANGESLIQPGSLEWFRAAAFTRGPAEGLAVRVVPEVVGKGGWDPAAAYRTFRDAMDRIITKDTERTEHEPQPGEAGPEERAETGDQPRGSDAPPTVQ